MKSTDNYQAVKDVDPNEVLSDDTRARIDHWLAKFPEDRRRSALIQAMQAAQDQNDGYLDDRLIQAVAYYVDVPPMWAYEVVTFYSMFQRSPAGRHHVSICTNISCWLNGANDIVRHCEDKLGVKLGESTPDKRIFLRREEECLAGCCGAPMMLVDEQYHENLTPEKVDDILDKLK